MRNWFINIWMVFIEFVLWKLVENIFLDKKELNLSFQLFLWWTKNKSVDDMLSTNTNNA